MFDIKETAQNFEQLLNDIVVKRGIFVPTGKNTIRYKNYLVHKNHDDEWVVIRLTKSSKEHIATVFLKVSAFAICKMHEKNRKSTIDEIKYADSVFRKQYIDTRFYRRTIQTAQNSATRDNAVYRFEVAEDIARSAKRKIDDVFYRSIV